MEISFLFVAATACTVLLDGTGYLLSTLMASFLHECGHLLMMALLGGVPQTIIFGVFNIDIIDGHREQRGYWQDILILLAGPFANILCFAAFVIGYECVPHTWLSLAASTHLVIGLFNLLPEESLDGGQILYALLCRRITPQRARKIVQMVSFLVLLPVAGVGFFLLLQSRYNFSLLLVSCYLMGLLLLKRER